jgi:hypothetical protein
MEDSNTSLLTDSYVAVLCVEVNINLFLLLLLLLQLLLLLLLLVVVVCFQYFILRKA